jgi:hypothetical protein
MCKSSGQILHIQLSVFFSLIKLNLYNDSSDPIGKNLKWTHLLNHRVMHFKNSCNRSYLCKGKKKGKVIPVLN